MARRRPPFVEPPTGTVSTLEELYRRYRGWLTARLSRRFDPSIAEDLVQDTYLRMSAVPPAEIAHPRALLLRTAINLGHDRARYRARRAAVGELLHAQDAAEVDVAQPPVQDTALQLKDIVLDLPPLYRDVFLLSRFQGLTYEEIASHLGIAVITVERRMAKALALCAARMRD